MYDILGDTLITTCPQQNHTHDMSPNDKEVTFFIGQKENSMSLKSKDILM